MMNRKRNADGTFNGSLAADARSKGLKQYIGTPCPKGHGSRRYACSGGCVVCADKSARAFFKRRSRAKIVYDNAQGRARVGCIPFEISVQEVPDSRY